MVLMLLDIGLRISELTGLSLPKISLEDGLVKVVGKGNKERFVPIEKQVQRYLWRRLRRTLPPGTCHAEN